jgi:hypothetical protein
MPRSTSTGAGSGFRPHRRVRRSEEVVLIPAINGRPVISRADMAARGVPPGTVNGWYRDRARIGHPEKAGRNSGIFSVQLLPGRYHVSGPCPQSLPVTVIARDTTHVNIICTVAVGRPPRSDNRG